MLKKELRKAYKSKRIELSENDTNQLSLKIANNALGLPIWNKTYYHLFLTIEEQKEVQTEYILNILHAKDKEVVISKSNFDTNSLTNYLLTDNTKLRKNKYNIPEPVDGIEVPNSKIEVVFIPLLAFDKNGNRVGYGKGFYDKMLSNCKSECIKIGVSFFDATKNEITDTIETDIPLDFCITPDKTYTF
jgi:5-formyltetrahydrofolate cyclo-ligase